MAQTTLNIGGGPHVDSLNGERIAIGPAIDNPIIIDASTVSGRHAETAKGPERRSRKRAAAATDNSPTRERWDAVSRNPKVPEGTAEPLANDRPHVFERFCRLLRDLFVYGTDSQHCMLGYYLSPQRLRNGAALQGTQASPEQRQQAEKSTQNAMDLKVSAAMFLFRDLSSTN